MNTLQVTCKHKDMNDHLEVRRIDFVRQEITSWRPERLILSTVKFKKVEWIDFGTTRWYPNNL